MSFVGAQRTPTGQKARRRSGLARGLARAYVGAVETHAERGRYRGELSYVSAVDGTKIAWFAHASPAAGRARAAESPLARAPVILTNGLSTTENFWRDVVAKLAPRHAVVHWHYRGHGASESARTKDYAIATHVSDLEKVTEAVRREHPGTPPVHVAFSMGVTVVLELYRRRPDLVGALVLVAGGADHPYASSAVFRVPGVARAVRAVLRVATPMVPRGAPVFRKLSALPAAFTLARAFRAIGPDAPRDDVEHFFRAVGAMDLDAYVRTLASLMEAHASDVLPTVRVPALIVAPERDVMALQGDLRALARGLPDASWVSLPATTHAILLEAGATIGGHIERFLLRE
jgi:pimeloyl-ACP methyl ester carboxylesterase